MFASTSMVVSWPGLALAFALSLAPGCQKQAPAEQPVAEAPAQEAGQAKPNPRVEADEDVQIKATHVAGNVYMLEGRGGNIGVSAGADGILMIDDQFAPLAPKIRAAIMDIAKNRGKVPETIAFLINTHHHGDHTGGNPEFGKEARIVAHANVRRRLSTTTQARGRTIEPIAESGWPVITYEQGLSLHWNGEEVKVTHLPAGHTDSDSVVLFTESKVLHMGDHFFNGRFPFVDLDSGGDVEGYIRNVGHVLEMAPEGVTIIPGHGPLAKIDDLRAYHQMLVATADIVRKGIAAGKTLDQLQAAGLPAQYASLGSGFVKADTWIATIHKSLTR